MAGGNKNSGKLARFAWTIVVAAVAITIIIAVFFVANPALFGRIQNPIALFIAREILKGVCVLLGIYVFVRLVVVLYKLAKNIT